MHIKMELTANEIHIICENKKNSLVLSLLSEISFSEVSCLRKNSIGEDSDTEDQHTEGERDIVDAAGDATKAFTTESDEGKTMFCRNVKVRNKCILTEWCCLQPSVSVGIILALF